MLLNKLIRWQEPKRSTSSPDQRAPAVACDWESLPRRRVPIDLECQVSVAPDTTGSGVSQSRLVSSRGRVDGVVKAERRGTRDLRCAGSGFRSDGWRAVQVNQCVLGCTTTHWLGARLVASVRLMPRHAHRTCVRSASRLPPNRTHAQKAIRAEGLTHQRPNRQQAQFRVRAIRLQKLQASIRESCCHNFALQSINPPQARIRQTAHRTNQKY